MYSNPPKPMLLSTLLSDLCPMSDPINIPVHNIQLDSRLVEKDDVFIAVGGGVQFIDDAIALGAKVILQQSKSNTSEIECNGDRFYIKVPNLKHSVSQIAAKYYEHPSRWMKVIGVTGTNGKTSCTQYIAQALQGQGLRSAVIGTLGYGKLHQLQEDVHTTPDPITLQRVLSEFRREGTQVVCMEVSSHALSQHRAEEVLFDIGIFTNLTRDHLDYHQNMQEYARAKRKLFTSKNMRQAIINIDCEYGRKLCDEFKDKLEIYACTIDDIQIPGVATIQAQHVKCDVRGISAYLVTPWGEGTLHSPLIGRFNLRNVLSVLGALCLTGMKFDDVLLQLSTLSGVPGRMQAFTARNKPLVVVDYAHTPDALENALLALREHSSGKLFCVFGCGGERDRGKRPLMAKAVARLVDRALITNDNPRREDPDKIVSDILQGFKAKHDYTVIFDRAKAIAEAIEEANVGDIVLVAGKGHEPYQQIGENKISYSDIEQVKTLLN